MRSLRGLALSVTLSGLALAGSNVFGIPGRCGMRVVSVELPTAPGESPSVAELSSVVMDDRWTCHAYRPAPDRQRAVFHLPDGIRLASLAPDDPGVTLPMDLNHRVPRGVVWHGDSRWLALWASGPERRVAVLDAEHPERGATTVYDPAAHATAGETRAPHGLVWASLGQALYVVERRLDARGPLGSAIVRLELDGPRVTSSEEVLWTADALDFAIAPPPGARDELLLGTTQGLFVLDPLLRRTQRLGTLPAVGLYDVAWHPHRRLVLLYFRRPVPGADGRVYRGLWLVDLQRPEACEQLYDRGDLHTVDWSPSGRYATWASPDAVFYRGPDDPHGRLQVVGLAEEIKGCAWHDDEQRLAITAGDRLLLHTVGGAGARALLQLPPAVDPTAELFLAEPCWQGDRIVLTAFEDLEGLRK